jgi:hypothetical protein
MMSTSTSEADSGAPLISLLTWRPVWLNWAKKCAPCDRPASASLASWTPSGLVVDDDVVRPLEVSAVDLDVAREQQPGTRARPAPVQHFQPGRGVVGGIGEALAHRRLGEAVGQRRPGRQDQWPVEGMGHDDSVSATLNV